MDSTTRLDYALFQLTPTRTRFDLVLFRNGKSEKLASGIFEPFVSHLKFVREQISRGGYSISLSPQTHGASWFTKATFERVVRFVSTPAVLERFVTLEREISQIEHSVHANESSKVNGTPQLDEGSNSSSNGTRRKSNDFSKARNEVENNNDDILEENSKVKLNRLLETRRALLRREQAMAYARGIVAGYAMDNIDDLISFADAFGASRLREACSNFKELCKKKHGDGLWMEALAAVEACTPSELSLLGTSGIVLTNETTDPNQNIMLSFAKSVGNLTSNESLDASNPDSITTSSDSKKDDMPPTNGKTQAPVSWPNQNPPYMYNFQGPFQQGPPYQGYPYPPMPPIPPQYPMSMQWPSGMRESGARAYQHGDSHRYQKSSSRRKGKPYNKKGSEYSEEEEDNESTESTHSDSESDTDSSLQHEDTKHSRKDHQHKKSRKKKSSRTVVIRNINYITPEKNNGGKSQFSSGASDDDALFDEVGLKQKVDDALGSLEKSHQLSHKVKGGVVNGSNGSEAVEQDFNDGIGSNSSEQEKSNENWNAFKNLLIIDENVGNEQQNLTNRSSVMDMESEKYPTRGISSADSFIVTKKDGEKEARTNINDFGNGENFSSVMKRKDCMDDNLLLPYRVEDSNNELGFVQSISSTEKSIVKPGRGEDWFIAGKPENNNQTNGHKVFDGDYMLSSMVDQQKSTKDTIIDDSFMLQDRPAVTDQYVSPWKSDISMAADLVLSAQKENVVDNPKGKDEVVHLSEPNDLCMVHERDSVFESTKDSWVMDYGLDITIGEANRRHSVVETNEVNENLTSNGVNSNSNEKDNIVRRKSDPKGLKGSVRKTKIEPVSRIKKPLTFKPLVQKSKFEKEEETRKKMEELAMQRQKRIAERTAAASTSKKIPVETKMSKDTTKTHQTTRETKRLSSVKAI